MKKIKKPSAVETPAKSELKSKKEQKSPRKLQQPKNSQNFTIEPRQMIKFELEDAKYNEEYERFRKNRKLRVKRSSEEENVKVEPKNPSQKDKESFREPKEILKFHYTDAIPFTAAEEINVEPKSKTAKREATSSDSTTSDTRKIKITHPLSAASRTKHVSYEELSPKMQKIVESAINDAVKKGKASEGDYLKFYYGDKIIKVPVSISKYISHYKDKELNEYYTVKTTKYISDDIITTARPHVVSTKTLFSKYQSFINYEKKPYEPEKPKSYVNFVTPKESPVVNVEEVTPVSYPEPVPKKSIYYYASDPEPTKAPGPVTFYTDETLPAKDIYEKPSLYTTYVEKPKQNLYPTVIHEKPREIIPITEDLIDDKLEAAKPAYPLYAPVPTSYVEYDIDHEKKISLHEEKNYAFGYQVSDYKTGNNFGHKQTKNNKEIKGEYKILLPDGRIQTTRYFADDSGFHAEVSYQTIH